MIELSQTAAGDGLTNDTAALNAAIASCGAGDVINLRTGDTYLISPGVVVPGGVKFTGSGAFKFVHQINTHGFICSQGDNAFIDTRFIGTGILPAYDGFAFLNLVGAENIRVQGVRGVNGRGTGLRMSDTSGLWAEDLEFDVSGNAITINDDAVGSCDLHFSGIRATVGCIGFGAESDDSSLVVSDVWLKDSKFALRGNTKAGSTYGVGFTKSSDPAHGAGAFRKYRNISVSDVAAVGFFLGVDVRGASGVKLDGISTKVCRRAVSVATGNNVDDFRCVNSVLDADEHGIVVSGPIDGFRVTDNIVRCASYYGIYGNVMSNVAIHNNHVAIASASGSFGIRATSATGVATGNRVVGAGTPYLFSGGISSASNF